MLVEPVRSRNPDFQPSEYLQELRAMTEELGIPLLFDEMVTGFRCHPGGAQAIFGVRADIATYGKVAGGGLPIGIVTGSALFMDTLDGGMWQFGDNSVPTSDMTWFAGTFVRHPLALAATKATLEHLKKEGPSLQESLNARSAALARDLNEYLRRVHAPIKVEQFASVLRVTFTEHQEYADLLFFHLRNRGILTYEGRPIFLTTAHTDEDLQKVRRRLHRKHVRPDRRRASGWPRSDSGAAYPDGDRPAGDLGLRPVQQGRVLFLQPVQHLDAERTYGPRLAAVRRSTTWSPGTSRFVRCPSVTA